MFLFDTSVFSYALKGHSLAQLYANELEAGTQNFISVQTVEEVLFVAENRRWGLLKRKALEQAFSNYGILPIDHETARLCATIRSTAKNMGRVAKEVGIELIRRT